MTQRLRRVTATFVKQLDGRNGPDLNEHGRTPEIEEPEQIRVKTEQLIFDSRDASAHQFLEKVETVAEKLRANAFAHCVPDRG